MSFNAFVASALVAITASASAAQQPPSTQQPPKPEFVIPRPEGTPQARPDQPPAGSYVIGPQDQLLITVLDEPDLTGKFRVDTDGTITYPYLNRIRVTGLTLDELRSRIVEGLQNGFLNHPQVRIEIDQFKARSVMVMGAVRTPGKVPLTGATMSLLEALALAGSPSQSASNEVRVQRMSKPGEKPLDPIVVNRRDLENGRTDLQVQDGDIINVPEALKFYIQGQVRNTGQFVFETGTTVGQALILAGGLTDRGSDRRISIERTVNGKVVKIDNVKPNDKVQAGDIITVGNRMF
ncbi:MAG TPA: polysaccharide biosynthesis/export family protein [Vicinamibacterales bacterium]|nr:polysaccharide biosynthesis/export family protein [Vicinamibacterales bacterium]